MHFHSVLFAFADDLPAPRIDEVLDHLRAMAAIPAVRTIAVGRNQMPVSDGWDYGMTIVFDSRAVMMERFGPHPLHQAVLRDDVPLFSRITSLDVADESSAVIAP